MGRGLAYGVGVLVALAACKIDGSIGREEANVGGEGDGTAAGETADGGAASRSAAGGSGGGSGGGTGLASSGSGVATTGQDTGAVDTQEVDVPEACVPTPDDGACAECRKRQCCEALVRCITNDACVCFWDCTTTDRSPEECQTICGAGGGLYNELHACAAQSCDVCP